MKNTIKNVGKMALSIVTGSIVGVGTTAGIQLAGRALDTDPVKTYVVSGVTGWGTSMAVTAAMYKKLTKKDSNESEKETPIDIAEDMTEDDDSTDDSAIA